MNYFTYYLDQWIDRFHHLRIAYNQTVPRSKQILHTKEKVYLEIVRRCIERMNRGLSKEACFEFRTNRPNLGRRIDISDSSVYRGLKTLEEAGFIQLLSRGRKLDFDIFVNPQLFFDKEDSHPFHLAWGEVDKSVENQESDQSFIQVSFGFKLLLFKNLTGFMSKRTQINNFSKLINSESEKWINTPVRENIPKGKDEKGIHISKKESLKASFSQEPQDDGREWVGWYLDYLLKSKRIGMHDSKFVKRSFTNSRETQENGKRETGLYQLFKVPNFEKQSIKNLLKPTEQSILECAEWVWKIARSYLYPHFTKKSDHYEYRIINHIVDVIELEYLPLKHIKKFQEYHRELGERILLAFHYIERHAGEKYVPSPVDYFNPRNSRGFVGTRKWFLDKVDQKEQGKKKYQKAALLRKAERAFIDSKLEGVQASAFQIYRYFGKQVENFKDSDIQQAYEKLAKTFCVNR